MRTCVQISGRESTPAVSLPLEELSLLLISNSEDRYVRSYAYIPARGLPLPLAGATAASLLAPSSAVLLTRRGQAHGAPASAQAPLPRRFPRLSSPLPCPLVAVPTAS